MRYLLGALALVTGLALTAQAAPKSAAAAQSSIAIGANYAHWACDFTNNGILATYDQPGVRPLVQQQLATMRSNGLTALRFMIWYNLFPAQGYGDIQINSDGSLQPIHAANLAAFASDVTAAGFMQLEISFAPKGQIGPQFSDYDPVWFDADWALVQQVRGIVIASGIPQARIDLLNEGAPNNVDAVHPPGDPYRVNLHDYLSAMYTRYYDTYGSADVTVSSIMEDAQAFPDLIAILGDSGRPLPPWFEVHGYFWWYPDVGTGVKDGLMAADAILHANGLSSALSLGETYYNNTSVANGVKSYLRTTTRPFTALLEWPSTVTTPCIAPPFSVSAYKNIK